MRYHHNNYRALYNRPSRINRTTTICLLDPQGININWDFNWFYNRNIPENTIKSLCHLKTIYQHYVQSKWKCARLKLLNGAAESQQLYRRFFCTINVCKSAVCVSCTWFWSLNNVHHILNTLSNSPLTTVLKNGCLRASSAVIRFSTSTTRHFRIKSFGSSGKFNQSVAELSLSTFINSTHPRSQPTLETWNYISPPLYSATSPFASDAKTADSPLAMWT